MEKPAQVKITAEQALATIRDVKIAVDGVLQVVGGLVRSINGLLDASPGQRQAMTLASVAYGGGAIGVVGGANSVISLNTFDSSWLTRLLFVQ